MEGIDFGWLMNAMASPDATDSVGESLERSRVLQAGDAGSGSHDCRDERDMSVRQGPRAARADRSAAADESQADGHA